MDTHKVKFSTKGWTMMFGREKRKSRLERENDALEERINFLEKERIPILERKLEGAATELLMMDGKYLRN